MANTKNVKIAKIRIDGGTQPRVAINEATLAEYAEALDAGETLPPLTVFDDGAALWLADGFHRYHAAKRLGLGEFSAVVHGGTRRDAVLFSVGANASHGLRRTNADKRNAVLTLLGDEEWQQWSNAEIARRCQVSAWFVGDMRGAVQAESESDKISTGSNDSENSVYTMRGLEYEPAERTFVHPKTGQPTTMQTGNIGKRKTAPDAAENAAPSLPPSPTAKRGAPLEADPENGHSPSTGTCAMCEELAEQLDELRQMLKDCSEDNESMARVFEADDRVTAALAEAKRFREQARIVEERNNGLISEKNQYIRAAKNWQRKAEKLEKELKNAAAQPF